MVTRVTIGGMRTVHCVRAVFTALGGIEGIAHADVTLGEAVLEHDLSMSADALRAALAELGYEMLGARVERTLPVI